MLFHLSALLTVDFVNVILFFSNVFHFIKNFHFDLFPLFSTIVCTNCRDFFAILSCTCGFWIYFFAMEPNLCTAKFNFYEFDKCFFTFSSDKQKILDRLIFQLSCSRFFQSCFENCWFCFFLQCLQ